MWRVQDGKPLWRTYEVASLGGGVCAAASPTAMLAAFCGYDGEIVLLDLTTMQVMRTWRAYRGGITALAFSPDGQWLAVGPGVYEGAGIEAYEIRVWDVAQGARMHTLRSPSLGAVAALAFSTTGQLVALTTTERFFGIRQYQRALHVWTFS